jgi:hypothetical protein
MEIQLNLKKGDLVFGSFPIEWNVVVSGFVRYSGCDANGTLAFVSAALWGYVYPVTHIQDDSATNKVYIPTDKQPYGVYLYTTGRDDLVDNGGGQDDAAITLAIRVLPKACAKHSYQMAALQPIGPIETNHNGRIRLWAAPWSFGEQPRHDIEQNAPDVFQLYMDAADIVSVQHIPFWGVMGCNTCVNCTHGYAFIVPYAAEEMLAAVDTSHGAELLTPETWYTNKTPLRRQQEKYTDVDAG